MSIAPSLRQSVESWIAGDPDARTRLELTELLRLADSDDAAHRELAHRFAGPLSFGTAGLRGPLAAGPNRMNRAVVIQAAAGLASYIREAEGGGRVVIGYDARHDSDVFATDSAAVLAAAGLDALLLPAPLPTPVLAFAIRHLGCVAGVMVTASHNPAGDNGYKVYLGDGCQIVPPVDADIAARIGRAPSAASVPRAESWHVLDEQVVDSYADAVTSLVPLKPVQRLRIVYTPLHGVGGGIVKRILQQAGFDAPLVVPAQAAPDAEFPTVSFPNPEEPGALDLALDLAVQSDADLVVANDPDADRCAVAVPVEGSWRVLRGDEIGVLLADALLVSGATGVYATTVVSSSMLQKLAREYEVSYAETLTGFKWLGRVPHLAYAYEEALGYCVAPSVVSDKDGISALLLIASTAASLRAEGRSLLSRLDDLAEAYGVHLTDQITVRLDHPCALSQIMRSLRGSPPSELGGTRVERFDDLLEGLDSLPPTDAVRYCLSDGSRVVVRPSGTELKLKAYLEVVETVGDEGAATARAAANRRLRTLRFYVSGLLGGH